MPEKHTLDGFAAPHRELEKGRPTAKEIELEERIAKLEGQTNGLLPLMQELVEAVKILLDGTTPYKSEQRKFIAEVMYEFYKWIETHPGGNR